MFQRCSWDRHQSIDRDGIDAKFSKADRHIQTVFPCLTHADDTAGAGTHAFGFDFFEGLDLHVVGVCGTDIREISTGGFDVVVVAGHTCLVKTVKLFGRNKSHGSAEVNLAFSVHGLVSMDCLVEFFSCQSFSGGDDGKRSTPSDSFILQASRIFPPEENCTLRRKCGGVRTVHSIYSLPDICRCVR